QPCRRRQRQSRTERGRIVAGACAGPTRGHASHTHGNTGMKPSRIVLALALLALAALFALWFRTDAHYLAALLVFALPPLLTLVGVLCGSARAAFWAGVLALFWFSHGVMVAYSRPAEA